MGGVGKTTKGDILPRGTKGDAGIGDWFLLRLPPFPAAAVVVDYELIRCLCRGSLGQLKGQI